MMSPHRAITVGIATVARALDSYPFNERSVRWKGYAID